MKTRLCGLNDVNVIHDICRTPFCVMSYEFRVMCSLTSSHPIVSVLPYFPSALGFIPINNHMMLRSDYLIVLLMNELIDFSLVNMLRVGNQNETILKFVRIYLRVPGYSLLKSNALEIEGKGQNTDC